MPTNYGVTEIRQDALMYLEPFVKSARDSGLAADSRSVIGNAVGAIIDSAEENEGSLIVMSTHGRSGFKRFFLGSVADKVVRSAGTPVLVLPPRDE
jgi:nucleotide-binding universal stress UspA family protein